MPSNKAADIVPFAVNPLKCTFQSLMMISLMTHQTLSTPNDINPDITWLEAKQLYPCVIYVLYFMNIYDNFAICR